MRLLLPRSKLVAENPQAKSEKFDYKQLVLNKSSLQQKVCFEQLYLDEKSYLSIFMFLTEMAIILPLLFIHSLSSFILINNKKCNGLIESDG